MCILSLCPVSSRKPKSVALVVICSRPSFCCFIPIQNPPCLDSVNPNFFRCLSLTPQQPLRYPMLSLWHSSFTRRFSGASAAPRMLASSPSSPPSNLPPPMKGGNYYNQNSSWQRASMIPAEPYLASAAASIAASMAAQSHLVIADLGCSQGGNSQTPVSLVIQELLRAGRRKLVDARDDSERLWLSVYHDDLPTNDFNSLFSVLSKTEESYLRRFPSGVFAFAVGKSFHQPLFPPASVHLAFSFSSIHFLSQKPSTTSLSLGDLTKKTSEEDRKGKLRPPPPGPFSLPFPESFVM